MFNTFSLLVGIVAFYVVIFGSTYSVISAVPYFGKCSALEKVAMSFMFTCTIAAFITLYLVM